MNINLGSKLSGILNSLKQRLITRTKALDDYMRNKPLPSLSWLTSRLNCRTYLLLIALTALCLMLLSGCSTKRVAIQPPQHLVAPINLPAGDVETPRQCVAFALELLNAYGQCEAQKRETVKYYKDLK